jgi:mono/diheme cytochrome c family protein
MKSNQVLSFAVTLVVSLSACSKEEAASKSPDRRMATGEKLYAAHCAACHQANGQGLAGAFPPLAESSYLAEGAGPAIGAVLNGLNGLITVNGADYDAVMPGMPYLDDEEVAKIITFVMNSWNNPGGDVSADEVAAVRGNE